MKLYTNFFSNTVNKIVLSSCLFALAMHVCHAQSFPASDKQMVLETDEGMIVVGYMENPNSSLDAETDLLGLRTSFGKLDIPLYSIRRINGERYDAKEGISREHTITLYRDGSVLLDYLLPIPSRTHKPRISVLTMGNVLKVADLNGKMLDFMALQVNDYTRCTIDMPHYRLPAVRLQVMQKDAADIQGRQLCYNYQYTPRTSQTFTLQVSLPANVSITSVTPTPSQRTRQSLLWKTSLHKQQSMDYQLTLTLP